jgi:hypothetical protein
LEVDPNQIIAFFRDAVSINGRRHGPSRKKITFAPQTEKQFTLMSKKILWLPAFRSLDEMVDRRNNMHVELQREPEIKIIFFSGTQLERQMFQELSEAYIEGNKQTDEIYDSIESHYSQLVTGLRGNIVELESEVTERMEMVAEMLKKNPEGNKRTFPKLVESVQLLNGSFLAFHILNFPDFKWGDAREIFHAKENANQGSISPKDLAGQLKHHLEENDKNFPLLTQGGLWGTEGGKTVVDENFKETLKKASELAGFSLILQ